MKRHDECRGRYTVFHLPDIEKCSYEKNMDSCICKKEEASLEEDEDIWSELEKLFKIKIDGILEEEAKKLLTEILQWIEIRDMYGNALMLSLYWEELEVLFEERVYQDMMIGIITDLRFSKE